MKHKARKTMRILAVGMVLLAVCAYNSVAQAKDTKLSQAVLENDVRQVKTLLAAGADAKDGDALAYAAEKGSAECVRLLLDAGADANARSDYNDGSVNIPHGTMLMIAGVRGSVEMVKLLLDAGADVNATDEDGTSVLTNTAYSGSAECIKLLLDAGADANVKVKDWDGNEYTALDYAKRMGDTDIVDLLVEAQKKR